MKSHHSTGSVPKSYVATLLTAGVISLAGYTVALNLDSQTTRTLVGGVSIALFFITFLIVLSDPVELYRKGGKSHVVMSTFTIVIGAIVLLALATLLGLAIVVAAIFTYTNIVDPTIQVFLQTTQLLQ